MRSPHHPKVSKRNDGSWVVNCFECVTSREPIPIGIGMPLQSEETARRLQENHGGHLSRLARVV